jgi:hypothetical protein
VTQPARHTRTSYGCQQSYWHGVAHNTSQVYHLLAAASDYHRRAPASFTS